MTFGWENLGFWYNKNSHNNLGNTKFRLDKSQIWMAVKKMVHLETKISGKYISIGWMSPTEREMCEGWGYMNTFWPCSWCPSFPK